LGKPSRDAWSFAYKAYLDRCAPESIWMRRGGGALTDPEK